MKHKSTLLLAGLSLSCIAAALLGYGWVKQLVLPDTGFETLLALVGSPLLLYAAIAFPIMVKSAFWRMIAAWNLIGLATGVMLSLLWMWSVILPDSGDWAWWFLLTGPIVTSAVPSAWKIYQHYTTDGTGPALMRTAFLLEATLTGLLLSLLAIVQAWFETPDWIVALLLAAYMLETIRRSFVSLKKKDVYPLLSWKNAAVVGFSGLFGFVLGMLVDRLGAPVWVSLNTMLVVFMVGTVGYICRTKKTADTEASEAPTETSRRMYHFRFRTPSRARRKLAYDAVRAALEPIGVSILRHGRWFGLVLKLALLIAAILGVAKLLHVADNWFNSLELPFEVPSIVIKIAVAVLLYVAGPFLMWFLKFLPWRNALSYPLPAAGKIEFPSAKWRVLLLRLLYPWGQWKATKMGSGDKEMVKTIGFRYLLELFISQKPTLVIESMGGRKSRPFRWVHAVELAFFGIFGGIDSVDWGSVEAMDVWNLPTILENAGVTAVVTTARGTPDILLLVSHWGCKQPDSLTDTTHFILKGPRAVVRGLNRLKEV